MFQSLCADSGLQLKRDSPAIGSWSIQDEIRRVRSRATEEMLRTVPSSKIEWSALAMEYKNNLHTSDIENIEASSGERVHNFTNVEFASSSLARGLGTQASPGMTLCRRKSVFYSGIQYTFNDVFSPYKIYNVGCLTTFTLFMPFRFGE